MSIFTKSSKTAASKNTKRHDTTALARTQLDRETLFTDYASDGSKQLRKHYHLCPVCQLPKNRASTDWLGSAGWAYLCRSCAARPTDSLRKVATAARSRLPRPPKPKCAKCKKTGRVLITVANGKGISLLCVKCFD